MQECGTRQLATWRPAGPAQCAPDHYWSSSVRIQSVHCMIPDLSILKSCRVASRYFRPTIYVPEEKHFYPLLDFLLLPVLFFLAHGSYSWTCFCSNGQWISTKEGQHPLWFYSQSVEVVIIASNRICVTCELYLPAVKLLLFPVLLVVGSLWYPEGLDVLGYSF